MKNRHVAIAISVLVFSLLLSGCGSGQLLGPTITPSATSTSTSTPTPKPTLTPEPTSTPAPTPTNTPIPVESILLDMGFVFDPSNSSANCTDAKDPCKQYSYIRSNVMIATIYTDGKFNLFWLPITGQSNTNRKLETVFQDIMRALYSKELADAIISGENPRSGEIGGYEYSYQMSSIGVGNAISVSVNPIR